ncbi:MAG TPA: metallophosphoesterase [Candidatus Saccharimonadales bacterium]|nr:metallophosphoesterase [Candidatus Saccharimonadales bacterium]
MKSSKFSRRQFLLTLGTACAVAPVATVADAKWIEPTWLNVRHLRIGSGRPAHRLVQFSDLHYKGDCAYAESVVRTINSFSPDLVCFTGDIMENARFLPEALEILSGVQSPLFGVPGNHDYSSGASFAIIGKSFAATGGGWLLDEQRIAAGENLNLVGITCRNFYQVPPPLNPNAKTILLMHYPEWIKWQGGRKFDLALAGHSHGGQVRLPFLGALVLPCGVGQYDLGLFHTPSGPLYVNPGIGWFYADVRFNCRPEVTVIEV